MKASLKIRHFAGGRGSSSSGNCESFMPSLYICCPSDKVKSGNKCCGGVIQPRIGHKPGCCGTENYDSHFRLCCNNTIQPRLGNKPDCCGTENYDSHFHMCCDGIIHPRLGRKHACCGTKSYNGYFFKCCKGVVKQRC